MRRRGEGGETLVEVVVATTILGIIGVGIIGAIATVLISTEVDRSTSRAETVLRSYVAAVQDAPYQPCDGGGGYGDAYTAPDHYTASVTNQEFWTGDGPPVVPASAASVTFSASCPSGGDRGLQRIDLEVTSTNGRATERITIFKRRTAVPAP